MAVVYSLTLAAAALWLLLERQACAQVHQENKALIERLNEATEKLAQNQPGPDAAAPATDDLSSAGGPLQKEFEGKSADEAAIRVMDQVVNLKSVQVLNRELQNADTAMLTTAFEEGNQFHTNKVLVKRVGNEWKLAGLVDN